MNVENKTVKLTDLTPTDLSAARTGGMKALRSSPKVTEAQITQKAEEFESVFLGQMLQHMFAGIETDEMFGGGHGEDVYRSFMTDEYAKIITKTGGIGVASHVKAELLRLQEMGSDQVRMPMPATMPRTPVEAPMLQNIMG